MSFRQIGSATLNSRETLIAQDGYWRNTQGLIEMWGRATLTGGGATAVAFPVPFPAQCFQVIANALDIPSTTIVRVIQIETFDVNGFSAIGNLIENGGTVAAPSMTALWRAIGF
jgi:hypothetical protein